MGRVLNYRVVSFLRRFKGVWRSGWGRIFLGCFLFDVLRAAAHSGWVRIFGLFV